MKRYLSFILCALLLMETVGCNAPAQSDGTVTTATKPFATTTGETVSLSETTEEALVTTVFTQETRPNNPSANDTTLFAVQSEISTGAFSTTVGTIITESVAVPVTTVPAVADPTVAVPTAASTVAGPTFAISTIAAATDAASTVVIPATATQTEATFNTTAFATTKFITTTTTMGRFPAGKRIKISCVGDSITENGYWQNEMQGLLPSDRFLVKGYGKGGTTAMSTGRWGADNAGSAAYKNYTPYTRSLSSNPDIVVIMFGINDAYSFNWDQASNANGAQFKKDYIALIRAYQNLDTHPEIIMALPPTVYSTYANCKENLESKVIPVLREIAAETGVTLADVQSSTVGARDHFEDGVHPSDEIGKLLVAMPIAKAVRDMVSAETGETFAPMATVPASTTTTSAAPTTVPTTKRTYPTDRLLTVSFIGDSITEGGYWQNDMQGCLPANRFSLKGYGVSGSTALKSGLEYDRTPYSYMGQTKYRRSLGSNPDIVVIMLGTNDTRPFNWGQAGNENGALFIQDYVELVHSYQNLDTAPQVFVVAPPKIHKDFYGINNQNLTAGVIPALYEVAEQTGAILVDAYTPTVNAAADFWDGVHPSSDNGKKLIASAIAEAIITEVILPEIGEE